MAAVAELVARLGPLGVAADALVGTVVIALMFLRSRRNPVNHKNVTGEIDTVATGHTPTLSPPKAPPAIASAKPQKPKATVGKSHREKTQ